MPLFYKMLPPDTYLRYWERRYWHVKLRNILTREYVEYGTLAFLREESLTDVCVPGGVCFSRRTVYPKKKTN